MERRESLFNIPNGEWGQKYVEELGDWAFRPTPRIRINPKAEYSIFFDENGNASYKDIKGTLKNGNILSPNEKYFCLTAVVINNKAYKEIIDRVCAFKDLFLPRFIPNIKNNDSYNNIVFHMVDIVHGKKIFEFKSKEKSFALQAMIYNFVSTLPLTVFSVVIDKEKMIQEYKNPEEIYHIAAGFIIERIIKSKKYDGNFELIFESRGHDKGLLNDFAYILTKGTKYVNKEKFKRIVGVYFNSKFDKANNCTEVGLEIADIISYSIFKHSQGVNFYWNKIERLLNYKNGLKFFPKNKKEQ